MKEPVCNLCGERQYAVVRAGREDGKFLQPYRPSHTPPAHANFRLVRCARCGLIYAWPRPAPEELAEHYARYEDEVYEAEEEGRRAIARRQLQWINGSESPSAKRLLDVGAATGIFLAEAKRAGYRVEGIEPSAWARSVARKKHGLTLRDGDLFAQRFPDASFDVVCLLDVIEHLHDPSGTMREVSRILVPGGVALLLTPDIGHWRARAMGARWWGMQQSHLYYFQRSTLIDLLGRAGLRPIKTGAGCRVFTAHYWAGQLVGYNRWIGMFARSLCVGPVGRCKLRVSFADHFMVLARKQPSR